MKKNMNRFVLLLCCAVVASVGAVSANAESKKKPKTLESGEAFVLLKLDGENIAALRFRQFQEKQSFDIRVGIGPMLLRVKAGRYYVYRIISPYDNVKFEVFPEPPEPSATIVVRPGAVTYVGDWTFDSKGLGVRFNNDTILTLTREQDLSGLDLWMALNGDEPSKAEWPAE